MKSKREWKGIIKTAVTLGHGCLYCQQPCSAEEHLGKGVQLVKSQKQVNVTKIIQLLRPKYASAESENSYVFL